MKRLIKLTLSSCAVAALLSGVSFAADPLLGGKSDTLVVADKDLANVKGTGYYAQLYSYYGALYAGYAQQYAGLGDYYNYNGYTGPGNYATSYYYDAYYYSSYATEYYYYAYYYSYYKS